MAAGRAGRAADPHGHVPARFGRQAGFAVVLGPQAADQGEVLVGEAAALRHVDAEAERLDAEGASIHFHVWTPDAFAQFLVRSRGDADPFEIEVIQPVRREFIVILRKTG